MKEATYSARSAREHVGEAYTIFSFRRPCKELPRDEAVIAPSFIRTLVHFCVLLRLLLLCHTSTRSLSPTGPKASSQEEEERGIEMAHDDARSILSVIPGTTYYGVKCCIVENKVFG